ncbi:MAG: ATP-binding protein [Eubacteriales bacterium]
MITHLDDTIDFINTNNLSFVDGLAKLTAHEIDYKEASMIRAMVNVGAFPHKKEVKDFDFDFQPSINKQQILDFMTLRFLENQENLVFLGPSGVGKTHLATAIGIACAIKKI